MNALLSETVRKYATLSNEELSLFYSFFEKRNYPRNSILLEAGEVTHEAFFVVEGVLRQFFTNEEGLEKTCNFFLEGEFATDLEGFFRQSRSSTSIVTLQPTVCLVITCKRTGAAIKQAAVIGELFKNMVEEIATENIRRIQSMLALSPEKQFLELIQSKPEIQQRVPQRYIAQYLGVAPESLSRIRKRMKYTAKTLT